MKYSEEQIEAASQEAGEAVGRMMDAMPVPERADAMGLLMSTVTHSIFMSQILAKQVGITPDDWQEHFLSVTACALMQFNYDTLDLPKEEVAAAAMQAGLRFGELLVDTVARMMAGEPDVPAPSTH